MEVLCFDLTITGKLARGEYKTFCGQTFALHITHLLKPIRLELKNWGVLLAMVNDKTNGEKVCIFKSFATTSSQVTKCFTCFSLHERVSVTFRQVV